jgi:DNA-3-methyladenine glycosylase
MCQQQEIIIINEKEIITMATNEKTLSVGRLTEKDRWFFEKPANELAPLLLGKIICHKVENDTVLRFRITETEAYCKDDTACHANHFKAGVGVETQNKMGGTLYDHTKGKNYGGFDIVANIVDVGEGVLIRDGVNVDTLEESGSHPRKLYESLKINKDLNGIDLLNTDDIWLEYDGAIVECNKPKLRINLGKYADKKAINELWNFTVAKITFPVS